MEKALRSKRAICFFILPALIWFLAIVLVPVLQSTYYSFLEWDGFTQAKWVGLANYKEMFQNDLFWLAVGNTLVLAAGSVFIQLPLAMILALVLSSGVRGERFYRTVYFVPVLVSSTVISQLWIKVYHPRYGMLNTLLDMLHLEQFKHEWLADTSTALMAVLIPMVWQYIGYHMLLFYSAAKSVSPDIIEAAKVDGANKVQTAVRVVMPQIIPMIRASTIFAIIGSLKSFDLVYILTNGGPLHVTEVPTLQMYTDIFSNRDYGSASSIAVFLIIECLLLTLLVQKLFSKVEKKF